MGRNLVLIEDHGIEYKLTDYLKQHEFIVHRMEQNPVSITDIMKLNPDIVLLDWNTQKINAAQACTKLFQTSHASIMITEKNANEKHCIEALNCGADDYLSLPLNPREVHARIKAISRRVTQKPKQEKLEFDNWILDFGSRALTNPDNQEIALSISEFDLLSTFVKNPQRILSRDELHESGTNQTLAPFDRRIDIQISRLRQKIETNPKKPKLIKTVRCGGYLFTAQVKPYQNGSNT